MLLYTRLATPKIPKRRSRAGCSYCKEKKKKCDETRPKCSRCQEHSQDCVYEPVKPRQRRRHDSIDNSSLDKASSIYMGKQSVRCSEEHISFEHWETPIWDFNAGLNDHLALDRYRRQSTPLLTESTERIIDISPSMQTPDILTTDHFPTSVDFSLTRIDGIFDQQGAEEDNSHDLAVPVPDLSDASLAMIVSTSTTSPHFEFSTPAFAEFSQQTNRRALVDHFTNVLSHLIVLREDEGNPFQQLVLPLSQRSPAVLNAIFALASAHLEHRGVHNMEKSVYFHSQAINGLASLIAKGGDVNKNELLAAIILLVYYEVLVQTDRSNIVDGHLKGAMAIMSNSKALSDPTGVFLERAFRFYDAITALSFGSTPILPAPGSGDCSPFPPIDCRGATAPVGNADTLLGMATSLWPIIYRLSTLGGLKKELDLTEAQGNHLRAAVLRTEFETTASAVELALQEWVLPPDEPLPDKVGSCEENTASERRMQSILNSAMAYRHSGFVYLYRTIYGRARRHAVVQRHAHISLTYCLGTVKNKGPMGALLWPLFVAACEAIDLVDRNLARQTFKAIGRRQGMTNIERAWRILEEVWRRADNGEDTDDEMTFTWKRKRDLWRRVSEDMGVTVVFG